MTWFIGSIWAYFAVPLICAGLIVGRHRKRSRPPTGGQGVVGR
jgi:hypothetical protein